MKLSVWIGCMSEGRASELKGLLNEVFPGADVCILPPEGEEEPYRTGSLAASWEGTGKWPDVFMAELPFGSDKVTQLLLSLRGKRPVDFIPVLEEPSPGLFTRCQQLGAVDYLVYPLSKERLKLCAKRCAALRRLFSGKKKLSQEEIDRIYFSLSEREGESDSEERDPERAAPPFPKASLRHARKLLLSLEERAKEARVGKISIDVPGAALALGVSKTAAREALEVLSLAKLLRRETAENKGRGRPKTLYIWTGRKK